MKTFQNEGTTDHSTRLIIELESLNKTQDFPQPAGILGDLGSKAVSQLRTESDSGQ